MVQQLLTLLTALTESNRSVCSTKNQNELLRDDTVQLQLKCQYAYRGGPFPPIWEEKKIHHADRAEEALKGWLARGRLPPSSLNSQQIRTNSRAHTPELNQHWISLTPPPNGPPLQCSTVVRAD